MTGSGAPLVPYFDYRETVITLAATATVVLRQAADRVAIIWGSANASAYFVSTRPGFVANQGFLIPANAVPLVWKYSDIGAAVTREWLVLGAMAGSTILVGEVFWKPKR